MKLVEMYIPLFLPTRISKEPFSFIYLRMIRGLKEDTNSFDFLRKPYECRNTMQHHASSIEVFSKSALIRESI